MPLYDVRSSTMPPPGYVARQIDLISVDQRMSGGIALATPNGGSVGLQRSACAVWVGRDPVEFA